ncbi:MAG: SpaA isopeptide-forming pilin-related protein, partial [Lachnospiraceae bacterium]
MRKQFKKLAAASVLSALMVFGNLAGYLSGQAVPAIAEETVQESESGTETEVTDSAVTSEAVSEAETPAAETSTAVTPTETPAAAEEPASTVKETENTGESSASQSAEAPVTEEETQPETQAETAVETAKTETSAAQTEAAETVTEPETSAAETEQAAEGESALSETPEEESSAEENTVEAVPFAVPAAPRREAPETYDLKVSKVWYYTLPEQMFDVQVKLQWSVDGETWNDDVDGDGTAETLILSEDNAWTADFEGLSGTKTVSGQSMDVLYRVVETNAGEDFLVQYSPAAVSFTDDVSDEKGITVNNKYNKRTIRIRKHWFDNANAEQTRPKTVEFDIVTNLDADTGTYDKLVRTVSMTVDQTLGSYYTDYQELVVSDLPAYDDQGNEIDYDLVEPEIKGYLDNVYETTHSYGDYSDIFNVYNSQAVDIIVSKKWLDGGNTDGRPENIDIVLYWNYHMPLGLYAASAPLRVGASASSEEIPDGYYPWQYGTIHVSLGEDEIVFDSYVWDSAPDYYGKIEYLLLENGAEEYGYKTEIVLDEKRSTKSELYYVVTNTKLTSVQATKVWDDGDDTGNRPETVTFTLRQKNSDGEYVSTGQTQTLDVSAGETTVTFDSLPAYDSDDKKIEYDIVESMPEGYEYYASVRTGDAENGFVFTNKPTEVKISKVDGSGSLLAGAHLQILDAAGNLVDELEWESSDTEPYTITGLSTGVAYTVHETSVPDGYTIADDVHFTIAADGTILTDDGTLSTDGTAILVENDLTSISISKVDAADQSALAGAHLQILDAAGNLVDELEWESSDTEPYTITGLSTGVTYTVHETAAPAGYVLADDIHFTISTNGTILTDDGTLSTDGTTLLVENEQTSVSVSKVDAADQSALAGAHLQILDAAGNLVDELEWESSDTEPYTITGLSTG